MVFSSLVFLFVYLPVVLLVYYLCPRRLRNGWLFVVNLVFYGWGEPKFVFLMLFTTAANYLFGLGIGKYRDSAPAKARRLLIASIVLDLGLLAFFKYAGFLEDTLNLLPFLHLPELSILLPIGISFYTFQIMSYTIDLYRGQAETQRSLIRFGTYVFLFPQLIAGPIVRYKDVAAQLDGRRESMAQFQQGVCLFCVGLAKKVLLANQMGLLFDSLQELSGIGLLGSWAGGIAFTFQIYFDFSGYSDMALGLGKMLGFEFLRNFNYPYLADSLTDFWRRWHISLSTWFRDYVYIPLGGNRRGRGRQILNLLIVWFLTGLWHGASYNFILWGLYYGVLLILEKFVFHRLLERLPRWLRHIYALFFIVVGWVIFYFEDFGQLGSYLASLFGGQGIASSWDTVVLLLRYLPLLLIAAVASTPLGARLMARVRTGRAGGVITAALCLASLFLCTCALVDQSYNPFLYFRF